MPTDEWNKLKKKLLKEIEGEYGTMADLARHLDKPRQQVNNWLRSDITPGYDVGKQMEQWLERRKQS